MSIHNTYVFHACFMHVFMHTPCVIPAHSMQSLCMEHAFPCVDHAHSMHETCIAIMHIACNIHVCCAHGTSFLLHSMISNGQ